MSPFSVTAAVYREEGLRGLWRGTTPSMVRHSIRGLWQQCQFEFVLPSMHPALSLHACLCVRPRMCGLGVGGWHEQVRTCVRWVCGGCIPCVAWVLYVMPGEQSQGLRLLPSRPGRRC